jgi:zinc-ribbon domain
MLGVCPGCGASIEPTDRFCRHCGSNAEAAITDEDQRPEAQPVASPRSMRIRPKAIIGAIAVFVLVASVSIYLSIQRRPGLSGNWSGTFDQNSTSAPFNLELSIENGTVSGRGTDSGGPSEITGSKDGSIIRFRKTYARSGAVVNYEGTLDAAGQRISGDWSLPDGSAHGPFRMSFGSSGAATSSSSSSIAPNVLTAAGQQELGNQLIRTLRQRTITNYGGPDWPCTQYFNLGSPRIADQSITESSGRVEFIVPITAPDGAVDTGNRSSCYGSPPGGFQPGREYNFSFKFQIQKWDSGWRLGTPES